MASGKPVSQKAASQQAVSPDAARQEAAAGREYAPRTVGGLNASPASPARRGVSGLSALLLSVLLIVVTGLLGPSAAQAPLPGHSFVGLPFAFTANPPQWLVAVLPDAALLSGACGLVLSSSALRAGWTPRLRPLIRASYGAAAAAILVPPMGSADHLVYAAYGRLVTTGGNPYTQTAHTLAAHGDPIGLAVQPPWTDAASVYGPVATAQQALASWIGGDSARATVFVLALLGAVAYVAMGAMLRRIGDPVRVTILFGLNPLLLLETVNAAHLDAFAVFFAVLGIYALHARRDTVGTILAAVAIGLGCATKLSLGLAALAAVWALRHWWKQAALFVLCAAATGLLVYLPYGLVALTPARESARMVSLGSAWRPLLAPLQHAMGDGSARDLISALGWATLLLLAWLLAPLFAPADRQSPGGQAARMLAVLGLAWVLAAPYTLPWYDIVAWAPLAVCVAGPVDLLATARTAVLSAAYIPGLDVPLVPGVAGWASWIRADAAPVFSIGAALACVVLGIRRRTDGRSPR
jgi:alpha-1,6-mannosyltransferase